MNCILIAITTSPSLDLLSIILCDIYPLIVYPENVSLPLNI